MRYLPAFYDIHAVTVSKPFRYRSDTKMIPYRDRSILVYCIDIYYLLVHTENSIKLIYKLNLHSSIERRTSKCNEIMVFPNIQKLVHCLFERFVIELLCNNAPDILKVI